MKCQKCGHSVYKKYACKFCAALEQKRDMSLNHLTKLSKRELHTKLHSLKKKIVLSQFNNQDYNHLEKEKDEILRLLGYKANKSLRHSSSHERVYQNPHIPTSGRITVVSGGLIRPR